MSKVIYGNSANHEFFHTLSIGHYFVYDNRLYVKVSDNEIFNAFEFGEDMLASFSANTTVLFKHSKDIEIKVN